MHRYILTLPMLRLLSSKAQGRKDFRKPSKPCRVGIHWIALTVCFQMSTHVPRLQSFFSFLLPSALAKSASRTSSVRVKYGIPAGNSPQKQLNCQIIWAKKCVNS